MAMRITGMNSGLDTEKIIAELVSVQKSKVDTFKKNQTSLLWKQDAWKELNKKALNLFKGVMSEMRFSEAYRKKVTKSSNTSVADVLTGKDAVNGVQEMMVNQTAKAGYLTGAKMDGSALPDGKVKADTTLSQLTGLGAGEEMNFSVIVDGVAKDIKLSGSSKMSDVVKQLKDAGVNANFDANNQRMFISSLTTGEAANFTLSAKDANGLKLMQGLGINVYNKEMADQYRYFANMTSAEQAKWIADETKRQGDTAQKNLKSSQEELKAVQDKLNQFLQANSYSSASDAENDYTNLETQKKNLEASLSNGNLTPEEVKDANKKLEEVKQKMTNIESFRKGQKREGDLQTQIAGYEGLIANNNQQIQANVTKDLADRIAYATTMNNAINGALSSAADPANPTAAELAAAGFSGGTMTMGQDAEIVLNGATFTSSTDNFEINGLTISVLGKTAPGEVVKLTTQDDTQGIYDTVKKFLKEYNALINEMDKLYNAASAGSYKPLTSEEKESMSKEEIEKWETKIKDASLRKDDSLSVLSSIMKKVMAEGVTVKDSAGADKKVYLSNFGIEPLSWFKALDNEKNAYHIKGDADAPDADFKNAPDQLKSMITNDPKSVQDFFMGLTQNLHEAMNKILLRGNDEKSRNGFYNDKKLKNEYDGYTKKIAAQEAKVKAMEDRYYKQFSAMEVALSKMQSGANALSKFFGS